jgi:glycosyltransferase involved in cell wall biosynthesis
MVRNEEYYIADVLRPLIDVFGAALVGDTGSSDRTVEIADNIPGVRVIEYGVLRPPELGQCREKMGRWAQTNGYDWVCMVDGDELYNAAALRHAVDQWMPEGKKLGYTLLQSIEKDDAGNYWWMNDRYSRTCIYPSGTKFNGEYPFESPDVFRHPALYHYWVPPPGIPVHGAHLHRLDRSPRDSQVFMRLAKQKQYALANRPDIGRVAPFDWQAFVDWVPDVQA